MERSSLDVSQQQQQSLSLSFNSKSLTSSLKHIRQEIDTALSSHTPPPTGAEASFSLALREYKDVLDEILDLKTGPSASARVFLTTTIQAIYHPTCPFARLTFKSIAILLQHLFRVELPVTWDGTLVKTQLRAGNVFLKDKREVGRGWEEMIRSILRGLMIHMEANAAYDAQDNMIKDQPYRTLVGESLFESIVELVFDENSSWRLDPETRYRSLEVLGEAIAKHSVNKKLLNNLVPLSKYGEIIAEYSERFTGSLGLEFAARVSEKSRREGQLVFPEETYGQENAKILVEKFVSITSVGDYFQNAEDILEFVGRLDLDRSQIITTSLLRFGGVDYAADGDGLRIWLCRDMIAAILELTPPEEDAVDEARLCVSYDSVDRVELKNEGAMTHVVLFLNKTPCIYKNTASQVSIDESEPRRLQMRFSSDQLPLFKSTLNRRSKLYKRLAIQPLTTNIRDAGSRKASQSASIGGPSYLLTKSNDTQADRIETTVLERAGNLADISEAFARGSSGSTSSRDEEQGRNFGITALDNFEQKGKGKGKVGIQGGAATLSTKITRTIERTTTIVHPFAVNTTHGNLNEAMITTTTNTKIGTVMNSVQELSLSQQERQATKENDASLSGSQQQQQQQQQPSRVDRLVEVESSELSSLDDSADEEERLRHVERKKSKSISKALRNANRPSQHATSAIEPLLSTTTTNRRLSMSPVKPSRTTKTSNHGNVPESLTHKRLLADVSDPGDVGDESNNTHEPFRRPAKRTKVDNVKEVESAAVETQKHRAGGAGGSSGAAAKKKRQLPTVLAYATESDQDEDTLEEKKESPRPKKKYGVQKPSRAEYTPVGAAAGKKVTTTKSKKKIDDESGDEAEMEERGRGKGVKEKKVMRQPKYTSKSAVNVPNRDKVMKKKNVDPVEEDITIWDELPPPVSKGSARSKKSTTPAPSKPAAVKKKKKITSFSQLVTNPQEGVTIDSQPSKNTRAARRSLETQIETAVTPIMPVERIQTKSKASTSLPARESTGHISDNDEIMMDPAQDQSFVEKVMQENVSKAVVVNKTGTIVKPVSAPIPVGSVSLEKEVQGITHVSDSEAVSLLRSPSLPPLPRAKISIASAALKVDVVLPTLEKTVRGQEEDELMKDVDEEVDELASTREVEAAEATRRSERERDVEMSSEPDHPVEEVGRDPKGKGKSSRRAARDSGVSMERRPLPSIREMEKSSSIEEADDVGPNRHIETPRTATVAITIQAPTSKAIASVPLPTVFTEPAPHITQQGAQSRFWPTEQVVNHSLIDPTVIVGHQQQVPTTSSIPSPTKSIPAGRQTAISSVQPTKTKPSGVAPTKRSFLVPNQSVHTRPPVAIVASRMKSPERVRRSPERREAHFVKPAIGSHFMRQQQQQQQAKPSAASGGKRKKASKALSRANAIAAEMAAAEALREEGLVLSADRERDVSGDADEDDEGGRWEEMEECDRDLADTIAAFRQVLVDRSRSRTELKHYKFQQSYTYVNSQVKKIATEAYEESAAIIAETDRRVDLMKTRAFQVRQICETGKQQTIDLLARVTRDLGLASLSEYK